MSFTFCSLHAGFTIFIHQKSQSLGLFYWADSRHGTKRTGHFYPGGSGKMGAVLVEEAGGKGLQGSMGQLGRPSVDEGCCHRVLEEAGCLSGFRVCEEVNNGCLTKFHPPP